MNHHHQNVKEITELCLGLPGAAVVAPLATRTKRLFADTDQDSLDDEDFNLKLQAKQLPISSQPSVPPLSLSSKPSPPKAQVVGWPPVRTHRQNAMKSSQKQAVVTVAADETSLVGGLVKVSIDGAPYLRKVDLKMYKSYPELSDALAKLFSSFTKGNDGGDGMIDFMNESKLRDLLNSSDFAKTYQDKDGDWMLVGDVPWEMFINSCKRLRIMKKSEAKGLAAKPMEKSS